MVAPSSSTLLPNGNGAPVPMEAPGLEPGGGEDPPPAEGEVRPRQGPELQAPRRVCGERGEPIQVVATVLDVPDQAVLHAALSEAQGESYLENHSLRECAASQDFAKCRHPRTRPPPPRTRAMWSRWGRSWPRTPTAAPGGHGGKQPPSLDGHGGEQPAGHVWDERRGADASVNAGGPAGDDAGSSKLCRNKQYGGCPCQG